MMKKNVLLLFGGCSSEHDVSLKSATTILTNIDKSKYEVEWSEEEYSLIQKNKIYFRKWW